MKYMSKLMKNVREAQKMSVILVYFDLPIYFLVSVSPWLSHIQYVYKVPYYSLQQFFVVIFIHFI